MFEQIIQAIVKACEWYLSTDLPELTCDALANIATYSASVLIPLMWAYIYEIFPE